MSDPKHNGLNLTRNSLSALKYYANSRTSLERKMPQKPVVATTDQRTILKVI